jgi:hypothetical protein
MKEGSTKWAITYRVSCSMSGKRDRKRGMNTKELAV